MNTIRNINLDFSDYNGTSQYYRHWLGGIYTDGMKAVADNLGAYWLLDAVFSYRRKEEFQLWVLEASKGEALLTMKEDSDRPYLVKQFIPYTDFPDGSLKMYLANGVLHLPSEY